MTKPRKPVWSPIKWSVADCEAIQALARGEAEPHQQKRAIDWIVRSAADTYGETHDNPYRDESEGGPRAESFLLGRRFVGEAIVKMINASRKVKAAVRGKHDRSG